jgi:hypothetical protein
MTAINPAFELGKPEPRFHLSPKFASCHVPQNLWDVRHVRKIFLTSRQIKSHPPAYVRKSDTMSDLADNISDGQIPFKLPPAGRCSLQGLLA